MLILRLTTRGEGSQSAWGQPFGENLGDGQPDGHGEPVMGKDRPGDGVSAHDPQRGRERQPVGVQLVVHSGVVHEGAQGVVDQQVRPDFLTDAIGGLGAQHRPGAALVELELVQGGLNLPSRMHS